MHAKCKLSVSKVFLCIALCLPLWSSCKDDYIYDDKEPAWLNGSLYGFFEKHGEFRAYKALIEDLGYEDILNRTGAVTLFPAKDEAFSRYFTAKGLTGDVEQLVHQLPESAKKSLFNSSLLNMTYLAHQLANVQSSDIGGGEGLALRRNTVLSYLDSVPYVDYSRLPHNEYWKRFEAMGGIYLADNGSRPMVHFTPGYYANSNLTPEDWNVITRGVENMAYDPVGIYVNGQHVRPENQDIICENGYVHVSDNVIEPQRNMSEIVNQQPEMSEFAGLMEKFAFPYFDANIDRQVKISKGLPTDNNDSLVFIKRYLNRTNFYEPGENIDVNSYGMLLYDPADNNWGGDMDMGGIFVPSNQALEEYWNSNEGAFLRDNYESFDDVATNVVAPFLQNHQRMSFKGSYPHTWDIMTDPTGLDMKVKPEHVERTFMANNGVVYLTNKVYPPVDYQSVYAPVMLSDLTKILNPVIKNDQDNDFNMKYHFYLRSLDNRYNLLVPTDKALGFYRDPITWAVYENTGRGVREIWSFRLDRGNVLADVYTTTSDGSKGSFLRTVGNDDNGKWIINNRLQDILDMHIVVADDKANPYSGFIDDESHDYLISKGGSLLMPEGSGENVTVKAGGEIENGLNAANVVLTDNGERKAYYQMGNGHTFFVDKVLQDPFKSVHTVLLEKTNVDGSNIENGDPERSDMEEKEFGKFFSLLLGDDEVMAFIQNDENCKDLIPIFSNMKGEQSIGIGMVVSTFQNYRYTVLIPSNEAVDRAFDEDPDLMTWEEISELIDRNSTPEVVGRHVRYLLEFLHYHFIDGMLPVSDKVGVDGDYETAARRPDGKGFTPIHAQGAAGALSFTCTVNNQTAHVLTADPASYNILTRDFIVNGGDVSTATQISASSRAVIHLVDRALNYHKKQ